MSTTTRPLEQRSSFASAVPLTPRSYRNRQEHEENIAVTVQRQQDATPATPPSTPTTPTTTPLTETSGVNLPMIKSLCISQSVILAVATAAALGISYLFCSQSSSTGSSVGLLSPEWISTGTWLHFQTATAVSCASLVGAGIAAAAPMIGIAKALQESNQRDATHVAFATTNMVVTLFGRRRQAAQAQPQTRSLLDENGPTAVASSTTTAAVPAWTALLTTVTAVSEEVVFRGYLPILLQAITHSSTAAWLGQAVFFGAGHWHVSGQKGENLTVSALQMVNGLWYGFVFALSGSLIPVITAHLVYDAHVFVSSWHAVNNQMDWTEKAYPMPLTPQEEADLQELQRLSGQALTQETLAFCRRFFYAFDDSHVKSLSLHNVQRAVSYAFLQDQVQPSVEQVQAMFDMVLSERHGTDVAADPAQQRLRLPEFLRLLFALRAQTFQQQAAAPSL